MPTKATAFQIRLTSVGDPGIISDAEANVYYKSADIDSLPVLGKYSGVLNQIGDVIELKSVVVVVILAWSKYQDHDDCGLHAPISQHLIVTLPDFASNVCFYAFF